MKHYLLIFTLLLSSVHMLGAFTVTEGEVPAVDGRPTVTVVLDFEDAKVDGLPLADYLVDIDHSREFASATDSYYADFIKRFNSRCGHMRLTRASDREMSLTVKVLTVNPKGNEAVADYVLTDTASGRRLLVVRERTREGRFGSFSNLVGDVMREAGGDLGSYLDRAIKKSNKNKK